MELSQGPVDELKASLLHQWAISLFFWPFNMRSIDPRMFEIQSSDTSTLITGEIF